MPGKSALSANRGASSSIDARKTVPAWFLRRLVVNYIMAQSPFVGAGEDVEEGWGRLRRPPSPQLPRQLIEEQFRKIALWPFVYKFSVLPIIHSFDVRQQLERLTMPI